MPARAALQRSRSGGRCPACAITVLQSSCSPMPVGVREIHIGGASVARGYPQQPGHHQARFVADPSPTAPTLYRTSDIGRFRADSNIEFIGRRDRQFKDPRLPHPNWARCAHVLRHHHKVHGYGDRRSEDVPNDCASSYVVAGAPGRWTRRRCSITGSTSRGVAQRHRDDGQPAAHRGRQGGHAEPAPGRYQRDAGRREGPIETGLAAVWNFRCSAPRWKGSRMISSSRRPFALLAARSSPCSRTIGPGAASAGGVRTLPKLELTEAIAAAIAEDDLSAMLRRPRRPFDRLSAEFCRMYATKPG